MGKYTSSTKKRAIHTRSDLSSRVSRRMFMDHALTASAVLACPGMLSVRSLQAEPKNGGILRIGMAGSMPGASLGMRAARDPETLQLAYQLRNNLVEVAVDGSLQPELATEWETTDAKTWVVRLRSGVEFHTGKTLTARDVVHTMNLRRRIKSSPVSKNILNELDEVTEDGLNVIFKLNAPNADFLSVLSDHRLAILPFDDNGTSGIGTGPFILDEYEPGVHSKTKRNPNYWRSGLPHFDGVDITVIADADERINALKTGQVDIINQVVPTLVDSLSETPGLSVLKVQGTKHYTLPMLANVTPFDSSNVRKALRLAIDRPALLDKVLANHGIVGNDVPIAPHQEYFYDELPQRLYDPDQAKSFLKLDGISTLDVNLSTAASVFDGAESAAQMIKEQAAVAGININVIEESPEDYFKNVWRKKPFCMNFSRGRPTQDLMWSDGYQTDGALNDNHWESVRFQELLRAARGELDITKRQEMYFEMQQLHYDDGAVIVPMFAAYLHGVSDKLGHPEVVAANMELDGMKCAERWWFA